MSTPTSRLASDSAARPDVELRRIAILRLVAVGVVVGAVAGFIVLGIVGVLVGVVLFAAATAAFGVSATARLSAGALDAVIVGIDASPLDSDDAPRLFNLLDGLCAVTGVQAPRVLVTADESINALVAADPARVSPSVLVVTRGFAESLDRIEMEGAVAVCLARLRSGVAESQTLATALAMSTPWYLGAAMARRLGGRASAAQAVFDADMKGAGITRYPPGLAAAYAKMIGGSTRVSHFAPETNRMWLADPSGETDVAGNSTVGGTTSSRVETQTEDRPALVERLALLREI